MKTKMNYLDLCCFFYVDQFNGPAQAVYRVQSVVSRALEGGVDPAAALVGAFREKKPIHWLERVPVAPARLCVANGDHVEIEGREYVVSIDGPYAFLMDARLDDMMGDKHEERA